MRIRLFNLFILLLVAIPVSAQTGGWEVVDIQPLSEIIDGDYTFANPILSPDGSAVAWNERDDNSMCVYRFEDETVSCTPDMDRALPVTRYSIPAWSPDSTKIAMHANILQYFHDGDLWVYDTVDDTVSNWTDDQFDGNVLRQEDREKMMLDHLVQWNPADGMLYFLRSVSIEPEPGYTQALYRMSEDTEPELVRDFTRHLPGVFSIIRPPVFSPDGTQVALIVQPANFREEPMSGVWTLSLENGRLEQVASMSDLMVAMPDWYEGFQFPDTVHWADGGLVIKSDDPVVVPPLLNAYYVDLETKDVTPMIDYSAYESLDDVVASGVTWRSPRAGAVLPDGSAYWYLAINVETRAASIYGVTLPPTGEPELVAELPDYALRPGFDVPPTVSADGKLLIHDQLITFTQE